MNLDPFRHCMWDEIVPADLSSGEAMHKANSLFLNINDRFSKDDAVYKKQLRDYSAFSRTRIQAILESSGRQHGQSRGSVAAEERSSRTPHAPQ